MGVTTTGNTASSVQKVHSGISIAFPDVCKTPTPVGPVPIPYPNTATTAVNSQKKSLKISGKAVMTQDRNFMRTGTYANVAKMEQMQLVSSLNHANARLQNLRTRDPNEWQKVLTEYAVLASALYRTLYPDG